MAGSSLGIDLGTSGVKLAYVLGDGRIAGVARVSYPMLHPVSGAMEQDPGDWLHAIEAGIGDLARSCELDSVEAIGLTGQIPTLVALCTGSLVGNAITWMDGRADAWVAGKLDNRRRRAIYRRTGMPIDGRYLAPMVAFHFGQMETAPDEVLSAKDYVYRWLTGSARTDPSTAAGYGVFALGSGSWDAVLAEQWGLSVQQLPRVDRPCAAVQDQRDHDVGRLLPERASALGLTPRVVVDVGAADSVAAVLGAGAMREGTLCIVPGSSTVVLATTRTPRLDPRHRYLVTPHALPGWYGLEMDLLATGAGVGWLSRLTGVDEDVLVADAGKIEPGARGLSFAPYLAGAEQGALWRDDLAGVLRGLTLEHEAAELMRAFLEGTAFEVRRCVGVLEASGWEFTEVVVAGGDKSVDPVIESLLADVLARPVVRVALDSAAARGAALLTGATSLDLEDPGAVRATLAASTVVLAPDSSRAAVYDTLYDAHVRQFPRTARRA